MGNWKSKRSTETEQHFPEFTNVEEIKPADDHRGDILSPNTTDIININPVDETPAKKNYKGRAKTSVPPIPIPAAPTKEAIEHLSKELTKLIQQDTKKEGFTIELVDDNIFRWNVFLINFDSDSQVSKDLKLYEEATGHDNVKLEIIFPNHFPKGPPFMRVVYPRFHQYTGHITIGGSICIKDLTLSGWSPKNELTSFFIMIRNLLLEGSALINMDNLTEYSEVEALEAFNRVATAHGWQIN